MTRKVNLLRLWRGKHLIGKKCWNYKVTPKIFGYLYLKEWNILVHNSQNACLSIIKRVISILNYMSQRTKRTFIQIWSGGEYFLSLYKNMVKTSLATSFFFFFFNLFQGVFRTFIEKRFYNRETGNGFQNPFPLFAT